MYELNVFLTCLVFTILYDYRKSPMEKLRTKFYRRNCSTIRDDARMPVKSANQVKPVNYAPRKRRRYRKSTLERFLLSCRPRKHKYQTRSSRRINGRFQYKYW